MRWRNTAVYVVILLLAGGWFYYFDVFKKEQKETEEKQAKQVFAIDTGSISEIDVGAKDRFIKLEKHGEWHIVKPFESEVDPAAISGFLSGLKNLEQTRKLGALENPSTYGLAQPALRIGFQAGDQRMELMVGDENPSREARYAQKTGDPDVFLIDKFGFQALNKTVKDFRKKELFTWQTDQVTAVEIQPSDAEKIRFDRLEDKNGWKEADRPDLKVKTEKVDKLIDQIHWLRASDFLEEGTKIEKTAVKLKIQLKDGTVSDIDIGDPDKTTMLAVAIASGFPVPVKVASHILQEIPRSAESFEDRSLLPHEAAEVRALKWKRAAAEGTASRTDENKWELNGKPLKDSWTITSLIEEAAQIEYVAKPGSGSSQKHEAKSGDGKTEIEKPAGGKEIEKNPADGKTQDEKPAGENPAAEPDFSGTDSRRVEFLGEKGPLRTISWMPLPDKDKGTDPVLVEESGKSTRVSVQTQDLRRLEDILGELAAEPQKEAK